MKFGRKDIVLETSAFFSTQNNKIKTNYYATISVVCNNPL